MILLEIAEGLSAKAKKWKNKNYTWEELVNKLSKPVITGESYKEYINASKEDQSRIKDVGGFVSGLIRGNKRAMQNIVHKQILTLDIDFANLDFWDTFIMIYDCAAFLHGTHKHGVNTPRFRLLVPLTRPLTVEEYGAVSRKFADSLDINIFDPTTFDANRLMFWPSISKDVEYYFEEQQGEFLNPDDILATYLDWKDISEWPAHESKAKNLNSVLQKQEDPRDKKGIIGAFCRTYSIEDAIHNFIPEIYEECGISDRYSYVGGSTSGGLVLYDNLFAYSHHSSDPCGGRLCNAFDLVRIHRFGHLDSAQSSDNSFREMEKFVVHDEKVKILIGKEKLENARYDFERLEPEDLTEEDDQEDSGEWMADLEIDGRGNYLNNSANINHIFKHDSILRKAFKYNSFDNKRYVHRSFPWRKIEAPEPIRDVDYSGIRNYMDCVYGISSANKIDDTLAIEFEMNCYNPVKTYLSKLTWDGVKRIDECLINHFGADDNIYSREIIRKCLVGAVARIFVPGIKFDLVLTLVGSQGTGKSTFIKKLGKQWYSDTFTTVTGKESFEQLQGSWIIEIAELSALKKAEVEAAKHFITKCEDVFRPAYGRTIEVFKRMCVFIATTNNDNFLKDPTGNRRFVPCDVHKEKVKIPVFGIKEDYIDQLWAEAVHLFKNGEELYLSGEAEEIAQKEQADHSEVDERKGIIESYLDMQLPTNWASLDLIDKRKYFNDTLTQEESLSVKGTLERKVVCIPEIWCECLGKNRDDMTRYTTRDINDIMRSLPNWKSVSSTKNFGLYGKQKYYERINN